MKAKKLMLASIPILAIGAMLCSAVSDQGMPSTFANKQTARFGVVNFKTCVEQSKMGKQEQANFEGMKKKMESILEEKEKTLTDMSNKLDDPDYLDSLSPEAETEMKRKFRSLSQELSQIQAQYMQTLQQANFKIVQEITNTIGEASKKVAEKFGLDVMLNDEGTFYYAPSFDISKEVVAIMDEMYESVKIAQPQKELNINQPTNP